VPTLLLALGANMPGTWGAPDETLARTQRELGTAGLRILRVSRLYATMPVGPGRQQRYLNAVLVATASMAPAALLRRIKQIERCAGRRLGQHWGPRCLDLDLLDFGGRRLGWPPRRREKGRLILPHPEMHRRAFVLVPLLEVDRHWWHPAIGLPGRVLLQRLAPASRAGIRQILDFAQPACDKEGG